MKLDTIYKICSARSIPLLGIPLLFGLLSKQDLAAMRVANSVLQRVCRAVGPWTDPCRQKWVMVASGFSALVLIYGMVRYKWNPTSDDDYVLVDLDKDAIDATNPPVSLPRQHSKSFFPFSSLPNKDTASQPR
jgi:hypothetical protein